ncbi:MAG: isopenicillin N synthase family oxygenase [Xanthomonadales bacterium]|nr:isopenicillin N synthase family oxygenase [Xanthomonadales bacterium]
MSIPTLDFQQFFSHRDAFVAELGAAYRQFGFVGIRNHGLDPALIDQAYRVFQAFFALPEEIKRRYHLAGKGGARGYTGFKIETAKDSDHPDLKEFWHIGRELPAGHPYAEEMPDNLWPTEVEGFRQYGYGLYEALDGLGRVMLQAIALHLGLRQDWFDDKVNHGNSILRPIHYPPIGDPETPSVRAGQHEDINLITLLIGSSAEGLQLLRRDGSWLPVTTQGDAIVCNIGDMLQRLTNHVLPSTTHRVVNPVGEKARQPRYSIPFFLHPNPDFVIETLPGCISADNPNRYSESITAQGYLQERLREIRLI